MLQQRVITAVILAALFIAAVMTLPLEWLALAFALVALAGIWEWSALSGWQSRAARALYSTLFLGLLLVIWSGLDLAGEPDRGAIQPWLGAACLFWSVAVLFVRSYPAGGWVWQHRIVRSVMGWLILAATWLSVMYMATLANGSLLVILLVVAVAAADIGAYFSGRQWGKSKLAPEVSPGKTWAGLWGGVAAVMAITALVWAGLPNDFAHLRIESLMLLGLAIAGASVLGDLTVSMVKRCSGLKDSGSLLPGHGGVLDRLDSICGAAPVFALGLMLIGY